MIQKHTPGLEEVLARTAPEIRALLPATPAWAVVPGTGTREILEALEDARPLPVEDAARAYVRGGLFLGKTEGRLLLAADPPREPWKGGKPEETLFLFRLLSLLGADKVFLSAAGASFPGEVRPGELVLAKDHLNFTGDHPLRCPASQEGAWPLFPDMTAAYPSDLRKRVRSLPPHRGRVLPEVVYAGVPGPSLPTPAEFLFYRKCGARVVSMSGPPWVEAAVQAGLEAVLILAVTQEVDPDRPSPIDLEAVLSAAEEASAPLVETVLSLVKGEGVEEEE